MATGDDIDLSQFDSKLIKQAIEALRNQPDLNRYQILKNEQEYQITKARLDQIWSIYLPLSEEYIKVRRKQDKRYQPENDRILDELRAKIVPDTDRLLDDLERHHAINMRVSAARRARFRLLMMVGEAQKILALVQKSLDTEHSRREAPARDTGRVQ
jgi:hypothetical protein